MMQYAFFLIALSALFPLHASAQTSAFDGAWKGSLTCGPNLSATARSRDAYTVGLRVEVVRGVVRGQRDTRETLELVTGSVGANGDVSMFIDGHWRDNPSQNWRTRLTGKVRGQQLLVLGDMGSVDGRQKFRECSVAFRSGDVPVTNVAPTSPPPAPAPAPAALPDPPPPPAGATAREPRRPQTQGPAERKPAPPAGAPPAVPNKASADKAAAERATAEKATAEKATAEKAAAEKAAAEKLGVEKAAADRLATEKAAAELAVAAKAASDKALAEKKAAEGRRAPVKASSSMDL